MHLPGINDVVTGSPGGWGPVPWLIIGNPYVALADVMSPDALGQGASGKLPLYWLISVVLYLVGAVSLFLICVRKFEQSRSPQGMAAWLAPRRRGEVAA